LLSRILKKPTSRMGTQRTDEVRSNASIGAKFGAS
jgi:hypothetical protein